MSCLIETQHLKELLFTDKSVTIHGRNLQVWIKGCTDYIIDHITDYITDIVKDIFKIRNLTYNFRSDSSFAARNFKFANNESKII